MQKDTFIQNKNSTQAQIIEAIKNNDETVLHSLYVANYRKVELVILKNNGSIEQAKDIFQEAYITVWKNIKKDSFIPKNETAINGYLYTIAKNKWMDYLRSSEYKKKVSLTNLNQINDSETNDNKSQNESDFDQKLAIAMKAFKDMGEPCKELLTKFYFEKKSMNEIANELSLDSASTRNKKYRCMKKLRELALKTN